MTGFWGKAVPGDENAYRARYKFKGLFEGPFSFAKFLRETLLARICRSAWKGWNGYGTTRCFCENKDGGEKDVRYFIFEKV